MNKNEKRAESEQTANNVTGTSASLCPADPAKQTSPTPNTPVPCQSVTSLAAYVAKYLCACERRGQGVLIPSSVSVSESFSCSFHSPPFLHPSSLSGPSLLSSSEPKFS